MTNIRENNPGRSLWKNGYLFHVASATANSFKEILLLDKITEDDDNVIVPKQSFANIQTNANNVID